MPDLTPAVLDQFTSQELQLRQTGDLLDIPGVATFGDALIKTKGWLTDRHNWARISWFVAGYAMIVAGLVIISKPAVDATTGAVAGTVGKVAKAVI